MPDELRTKLVVDLEQAKRDAVELKRTYQELEEIKKRLQTIGSATPSAEQRAGMRGAAIEDAAYREEARRAARAVAAENAAQRSGMRMAAAENAAYREEAQRQAATQRAGMRAAAAENAAYREEAARQARAQREGFARVRAEEAAYREEEARSLEPIRSLARQARRTRKLAQQAAHIQSRSLDPQTDTFFRAIVAEDIGTQDEAQVTQRIAELQQYAETHNMTRASRTVGREEAARQARAQREGFARVRAEQAAYREEEARSLEPIRERARLARSNRSLSDRAAYLHSRGLKIQEDEDFRALVAESLGTDDEVAVSRRIDELWEKAKRENKARMSKEVALGYYGRLLSASGIMSAGTQLGIGMAGAAGEGGPADIVGNQTSMGAIVGAILSTVITKNPFIGVVTGGITGGLSDAFSAGERRKLQSLRALRQSSPLDRDEIERLRREIINYQNPDKAKMRGFLGIPGWIQRTFLGTGFSDLEAYQSIDVTGAWAYAGIPNVGATRKYIHEKSGIPGWQAFTQAYLPFFQDVSMRRGLRQYGPSFLRQPGVLQDAVNRLGYDVTSNLLSHLNFRDLIGPAREYEERLKGLQANVDLLQASAGIRAVEFQEVMARGASPSSPAAMQASDRAYQGFKAAANALNEFAESLSQVTPEARAFRQVVRGMAASFEGQATAQFYGQRDREVAELGSIQAYDTSMLGLSAVREEYGRPLGTLGASAARMPGQLSASAAKYRRLAGYYPRNSPVWRRWMEAAAQTETQIPALEEQNILGPFQETFAFDSGRQAYTTGLLSLREGLGAGTEELMGRYGTAISQNRSLYESAHSAWYRLKNAGLLRPEVDLALRGTMSQLALQQEELAARRDYLPYRRAEAEAQRTLGTFEAGAGYIASLGLDTPSAMGLARERRGILWQNVSRIQEEARFARGRGETERAAILEAQATELGFNSESQYLSTLASLGPSPQVSLQLERARLGMGLAAGDLATGGQVPLSLRRRYMGALAQRQSELDYVLSNADPEKRQAIEVAQMGERSSIAMELQQQTIASQLGDMGRVISLTAGTTGDWTLFGPSIRDFQRLNPGGSMTFGGSGSALTSNPFAPITEGGGMPMGMAGAIGGTNQMADSQTHALLRDLIQVVREGGRFTVTSTGSADSRASLSGSPQQSQVKAANGMPF
jgi:hypothetical protein